MTDEITKPLDHANLLRICQTIFAARGGENSDYGLATNDLIRSAIATFQACQKHEEVQAELPLLKAHVETCLVQDGETYRALDEALDSALADDLHGEEKTARLKPARDARKKARKALHKANQAVIEGERAIVNSWMTVNLDSQTLMYSCHHWALFVFGTSEDDFAASRQALNAFNRSGKTADLLQFAAKQISDSRPVPLGGDNVTHLPPRTRTPDAVRENAMVIFLAVFLPEIAQSESFKVLAEGEGYPLLDLFSGPLVQAFQWHVNNEPRTKRAAAG